MKKVAGRESILFFSAGICIRRGFIPIGPII
jgi:hypothetical protein